MDRVSSRVILRTGLQVVGVVTIINGLNQAIATLGIVLSSRENLALGIQISSVLVPMVIILMGIYLTIASNGIAARLNPDSAVVPDSGETLFVLALKILGAVLVVHALPDAVQLLSNVIYIKSVSPVWNTGVQSQFIYTHLISTLIYFGIGWYLLRGGRLLVVWAFPSQGVTIRNF